MQKSILLHFFIGTEAELFKVFPVIVEAKKQGFNCNIITSGQNDIKSSPYLTHAQCEINLDICTEYPRGKGSISYLLWFLKTLKNGKKVLKSYFKHYSDQKQMMIVHGDTLSTMMGSKLARKSNMVYSHIESGLRSYNFLSPFPEEIDRLYSSLHSVINFCQKKEYAEYAAKRFKGKSVNTIYNTGIETLMHSLESIGETRHISQPQGKYFMFMIHRQENLMSKKFLQKTVKEIIKAAEKMQCVFIYHNQTRSAMENAGAFNAFMNNDNIVLLERQPYPEFIKLVLNSEFVISDGCGNQQELFYLGKPYLIMRTKVEMNSEGLGHNAQLFDGDFTAIGRFVDNYYKYAKERIKPEIMPSEIIVKEIAAYFDK